MSCFFPLACHMHDSFYIALFPLFCVQNKDHIFRGHNDSVDQLCWHPTNPDMLATASGDKTVRIWDTRSNKSASIVNTKG